MKHYFFTDAKFQHKPSLPMPMVTLPYSWSRPLAIALITLLVVCMHFGVMFGYLTYLKPDLSIEAPELPSIDIALQAPISEPIPEQKPIAPPVASPKPVSKRPIVNPNPVQKPKPKPLPKPVLARKPKLDAPSETQTQEAAAKSDVINAPPAVSPPAPGNHAEGDAQRSQIKTVAARVNPNYLDNPSPEYPSVARENQWEGLVKLKVKVNAEGQCSEIFVKRSSGHAELDDAAMAAVRRWHFIPGRRGDTPVSSWVTVPIEFELD